MPAHLSTHCRLTRLVALTLAFVGTSAAADSETRVLRAGKVYTAPDREPIADGVVLIRDGKILAVGPTSAVTVPLPFSFMLLMIDSGNVTSRPASIPTFFIILL